MTKLKAVVVAAGKGTRLRPLTYELAKPLIPLKDKTIIERIIDILVELNITEIAIVVGYLKDQIEKKIKNYRNLDITFIQQKEQLGTANATLVTKNFIKNSDFVQLNGDLVFDKNILKRLIEKQGYAAVLALREVEDVSRFGIIETNQGLITNIIEKPKPNETKSKLANTGIYRFTPKIFQAIKKTPLNPIRKEYEITDSIKLLLKKEKVSFIICKEPWIGVEDEADLKIALEIIKNEYNRKPGTKVH